MNGLYGRTISEALTGGEQGQPRLILVEADGQDYAFTAPNALTSFKRPRKIVFVDQLPRNPTGKVLRRMLRCGD